MAKRIQSKSFLTRTSHSLSGIELVKVDCVAATKMYLASHKAKLARQRKRVLDKDARTLGFMARALQESVSNARPRRLRGFWYARNGDAIVFSFKKKLFTQPIQTIGTRQFVISPEIHPRRYEVLSDDRLVLWRTKPITNLSSEIGKEIYSGSTKLANSFGWKYKIIFEKDKPTKVLFVRKSGKVYQVREETLNNGRATGPGERVFCLRNGKLEPLN